ncbi:MAG: DUF177 domain-containing protein [Bacteroidales bacterium]|nr:DUF177 domain-containing protein [Bacteroidales bacterium]
MNDKFIIPLNGLASGENRFSWHAGKEFFETFENAEILDADLDVSVVAEKSGRYLGVDCEVDGTVTVVCDRCLEDLVMPIGTDIMMSVKYGDEDSSEDHQEGEREIVFVPEGEAELDLSQIIYDYVCLSLPMQRHHEEGECNPEAMKHLTGGEPVATEVPDMNNPFAALKELMK